MKDHMPHYETILLIGHVARHLEHAADDVGKLDEYDDGDCAIAKAKLHTAVTAAARALSYYGDALAGHIATCDERR